MKVCIIRMETSLAQLIVVGLVFVREVMSDVTLRNVQPQSVVTHTENQDPVVLPARKVRLRLQLVQNHRLNNNIIYDIIILLSLNFLGRS